jgi:hypothetical protein
MAIYHLYYLKGGQLVGSEDVEAASDNEAARIAEDRGRGDLVEVWNRQSRVRIVATGGAQDYRPLAWEDAGSSAAAE